LLQLSGAAPISNGVAAVTVNGLECEVTYTITAGGTLNGRSVGPRSSYGTVTAGSCPAMSSTSEASSMYLRRKTCFYM